MNAPTWWRLRALGAVCLVAASIGGAGLAKAQFSDTIPSQTYYRGIEFLYRGEFRDAQRTFNRSLQGGVKSLVAGGTVRWVDSICYHAMLGETFYHWGQPEEALEQFNYACSLYLQYPKWMIRAQFDAQPRADSRFAQVAAPWGASQRRSVPARFPDVISVAQGQLDNTAAVQQGGVVQLAQLWPVDVVEVVRCTALAIRRRNELLGPLGPHDPISKNLVVNLSRGGAPPNHWSNAWIDVMRGLAHVGVGETQRAIEFLDRGMLVAGQFDHPLTSVALLEQGRIALEAGNSAAAGSLLAEASYSAFVFEDAGVIDDAFRLGELNRLSTGEAGLNPALAPAAEWARRERLDYLASRINLALAEALFAADRQKDGSAAFAAGVALLNDARTGVLGNWAQFLEAKLEYLRGRETAPAKLDTAVEGARKISVQNFQLALANNMFDAQTLPTRFAGPVYEVLLADPGPVEAVLRPLESMAVMTTPHDAAFERWLLAALERKNLGAAVEVVDRAKRRRFHNELPWGGRLSAIRDIVASPAAAMDPRHRQQRNDLRTRFPDVAKTLDAVEQLRGEIDRRWLPEVDDDKKRELAKLWDQYADALDARELVLGQAALARVPADLAFPPLVPAAELQARLEPGHALVVFHDTSDGLLGFLITAEASSTWNCGPSGRLAGPISQFLRDLGNVDASHEMTPEELAADKWQASGAKLFEALFEGSSIVPSAVKELIIVPDGIIWYVPFEAMMVADEAKMAPLVTMSRVRYAPTAALAFSFEGAWRRVKRTGLAVGEMVPGDKPEERLAAVAPLEAALEAPMRLQPPSPASPPILATLLDELIVLADIGAEGPDPLAWTPLALDRPKSAELARWMVLAGAGPQRIVLPGMHTIAERGGKASRRRGARGAPGDELFYASCGLMSAGAETMLLSRWRVGGQSTLELVREFVQELPHTSAADAWQRSVQLAAEMPVDPLNELRIKAAKANVELTAAHPFFWAGYMVVDSGWKPAADVPLTPPQAGDAAAPAQADAKPPAAAPVVPPQDPKREPAEGKGAKPRGEVPPPPKPSAKAPP